MTQKHVIASGESLCCECRAAHLDLHEITPPERCPSPQRLKPACGFDCKRLSLQNCKELGGQRDQRTGYKSITKIPKLGSKTQRPTNSIPSGTKEQHLAQQANKLSQFQTPTLAPTSLKIPFSSNRHKNFKRTPKGTETHIPRPSSYPLLGPKYLLLGTLYLQLRVQGGSWLWLEKTQEPKSATQHTTNPNLVRTS